MSEVKPLDLTQFKVWPTGDTDVLITCESCGWEKSWWCEHNEEPTLQDVLNEAVQHTAAEHM